MKESILAPLINAQHLGKAVKDTLVDEGRLDDKGTSQTKVVVSSPFKRAKKIQELAASVGFDWPDIIPVIDKIHEELEELKEEIAQLGQAEKAGEVPVPIAVQEEFGDLLFACVNLSRFLNVDSEDAIELTNQKFIDRFRYIENRLIQVGRNIEDVPLDELDKLWEEAKTELSKTSS